MWLAPSNRGMSYGAPGQTATGKAGTYKAATDHSSNILEAGALVSTCNDCLSVWVGGRGVHTIACLYGWQAGVAGVATHVAVLTSDK